MTLKSLLMIQLQSVRRLRLRIRFWLAFLKKVLSSITIITICSTGADGYWPRLSLEGRSPF